MTAPAYRLVRPPVAAPAAPVLDADQQRVVDHPGGPLRVLAGPGSGKTTTLVEAVVARVARGVPVDQVLVLTFGRGAAAELRDRVTARLGRTVREPVARTLHSYAYGVLRLAAVRDGLPAPRLLVAAEQDAVLRELLGAEGADAAWPAALAPALRTDGFADELRELLSRAVERGLDAVHLDELGRRHGRTEWRAAARFLQEYRDVTSWNRPGAFDTAELVAAALHALRADAGLLAAERARRRHVFVDEYQDVDPAQAALLREIATGAEEFVVVGDPDQSIYAFRGSEPRALDDVDADLGQLVPTVALRTSRRAGDVLLAAGRRVVRGLGRDSPHHRLVAAPGVPAGELTVHLFRSPADEAVAVAAALRRAHLEQGLPWSRMAVLVRSAAVSAPPLRRALAAAGVPVQVVGDDAPPAAAGVVDALLRALPLCVARPGSPAGGPSDGAVADAEVEALLLGPLARLDPLALRRLRRALARAYGTRPDQLPAGTLAALLERPAALDGLPFGAAGPVGRLARVLAAGRGAGPDPEAVLWALWDASGLAVRWERASLAGGLAGQAADRELDAVVALFEAAARHTDAVDAASAAGLVDAVRTQLLPVAPAGGPGADTVRLLTAHAAKGLEWDLVWVAGVQEGLWPDVRRRGSVLGVGELTDAVAGRHAAGTDHLALALAEERRLFYVAVTRARRRLVVSAVQDADSAPSRFLDELDPPPAGDARAAEAAPARPLSPVPRGLHLSALVAELRAVVTDPAATDTLRVEAAGQLARLAAADVPGADPDTWWGLRPASTDGPVRDPADGPVRLSPSKLEAYRRCQLQALLSELGAHDGDAPVTASLGTVVHAVADRAPDLADVADLERRLDALWPLLEFDAPWYGRLSRAAAGQFLQRLADWYRRTRAELTELGTETAFRVPVGDDVVLSGSADRLERDAEGRVVVIDLKTTSSKPSAEELLEHPQLAAYQLAVRLGAFADVAGPDAAPGGGRLLQLRAGPDSTAEQGQPPLTDPAAVVEAVTGLGRVLRGARVLATVNDSCDRCSVQQCCPARPGGRAVTT